LIGMYAKRGFEAPERKTPAIPSIACTRPLGSPVKSTESCHRTDSPSSAAARACSSHGPNDGSSAANAGAVVGVMQTK
jgi:hypothetical protein